jgi:sensor histidine kinase YesM
MLIQPIVENCLKHGLAPKIEGGKIQLRATNRDGVCASRSKTTVLASRKRKMPHVYVEGIGLSNVRERLRVLYGADFPLVDREPARGARSSASMCRNWCRP